MGAKRGKALWKLNDLLEGATRLSGESFDLRACAIKLAICDGLRETFEAV